jgi:hypothetical protein
MNAYFLVMLVLIYDLIGRFLDFYLKKETGFEKKFKTFCFLGLISSNHILFTSSKSNQLIITTTSASFTSTSSFSITQQTDIKLEKNFIVLLFSLNLVIAPIIGVILITLCAGATFLILRKKGKLLFG